MAHDKHAQITVESVFISRFTMNNFAPKLQKCWTHKIASKIISKMLNSQISLQAAVYISKGCTCKVLSFYDVWFKFYDKFFTPTWSLTFYAHLSPKSGTVTLTLSIDPLWRWNFVIRFLSLCETYLPVTNAKVI